MNGEELATRVVHELERGGLARLTDDRRSGGFVAEPDDGFVHVGWMPSDQLSQEAFAHIAAGEITAPVIHHMGMVKGTMADAMLAVLRSAAFNAIMSIDEYAPGTIEVRPVGTETVD